MHRSHPPPMDTGGVVVDDDDDMSNHDLISSTTADYSSLMVDSPADSMSHRASEPARSPSPNIPGSQTVAPVRSPRRRFSHSTSPIDSNGCNPNVHRDRVRFNTWPRHRREKRDILVDYDKRLAKSVIQELGIGINKTYRNPWGNLSYAQLITRAIDSSPWKRLTLNEVYEWIVKFVPYFKDKIDAKTSWGWKVSRFVCLERRDANIRSTSEFDSAQFIVAQSIHSRAYYIVIIQRSCQIRVDNKSVV